MYKIQHIREVIRDLWAGLCDNLSPGWKLLKSLVHEPFGRFQWLPVVYCLVLALSLFGLWNSLAEFFTLFWGTGKHPSILRRHKYRVLRASMLRKFRLVGSLVMICSWLLLWYALILVSPELIKLWITINAFMFFYELIIWIIEIFHGTRKVDVRQLVTFVLPLANLLFVCCVRSELQRTANARGK